MLLETQSVRARLERLQEILLSCANYLSATTAIKDAMPYEDRDDDNS